MRRVLEFQPTSYDARMTYARFLAQRRRWNAAADVFRAIPVGRLQPAGALPIFVETLSQAGMYAEAVAVCLHGLKIAPDDGALLRALVLLRATCPDPAFRDAAAAVRLAEQLVRQRADDPLYLDALACAYAEAGRFPAAAGAAEQGLHLARRNDQRELAAEIEVHLRLFQAGRPVRQPSP